MVVENIFNTASDKQKDVQPIQSTQITITVPKENEYESLDDARANFEQLSSVTTASTTATVTVGVIPIINALFS